jgi:hypothetical protein
MVWETHKVCEEASHNQFASLYLLPHYLLTSKTYQATHRPLTHPADIPRMKRRAGCRLLSLSTSLVCKLEPEINFHHLHLPHVQKRAGGSLFSHSVSAAPPSISLACKVSRIWTPGFFTSLACKSELGVDFYCISAPLPRLPPPSPPILTSQSCMTVSIDTCFAVARFFGCVRLF